MNEILHKFWVTALLLLICQSLSAYDACIDGIFYYFSGTNAIVTYATTSYNSYSGNVVVPESVSYDNVTYDVTSISDFAFRSCTGMTSISIPNSVKTIGDKAFGGCTGLASIVIPNSVTGIGNYAFQSCSSLTNFEIPDGVTSIGSYAFHGCTGLTSIEIPNSVTVIGGHAFQKCTSLTNIVIPSSVTSIENMAFSDCTGLMSIVIPSGMTSIGNNAFQNCSNLTNIVIPSSVTSIGSNAFNNTAWYNMLPDGLIYAGKVAYKYKGTMPTNTCIVVKDGTLGIAAAAFSGCTGLTNIEIPSSVTKIGNSAFYNCTGLTSIIIPNNVKNIGDYTFSGCSNLKDIICKPEIPPLCETSTFGDNSSLAQNCTLYVPESALIYYRIADVWKYFSSIQSLPKFTTSYIVDGEVYKQEKIALGDTIVPLAYPQKSGYTFSGWSGFPVDMIMPDNDLEITGTFTAVESLASLEITDGTEFVNSDARVCETLTYTRSFPSTNWQSLYVPFAIPIDTLDKYGLTVAELNDTHQWDLNGDGVADSTRVEFFTLTSGSTLANYPYLIRANEAPKTFSLRMEDVEVAATEENSYECSSFKQRFTVVGTYAGVSGQEMWDNNYYGMSGGGLKRVSNATVSLKPQRWYMKVENKNGDPVTYYAASLRIAIDGIDEMPEATDIEMVCGANGEAAIYGIDGMRYRQKPSEPGLYVQGGKKIFIR